MRRVSVLVLSILLLTMLILPVVAQDATEEPTDEATAEATDDVTPDATDDTTPEATTEATAEATADTGGDTTTGTSGNIGGTVTCGSDLIVMWYIAERYFGFGAMNQAMVGSGMGVDTSLIDRGQFSGLFDTMSADSSMMDDAQMGSMSDMMMMDDATMMQSMGDTSGMTTLNPSIFADEPAECAALRTSLNRFFTSVALQDMAGGPADAEATAEASSGSTAGMENVNLTTALSGANEVPGPGDSDGTGTSNVTVDFANGQVCYSVTVQNIALPATGAHIHIGAAGESGPVVVPFDKAPDASGTAEGCVLVSDTNLLNDIASNPAGYYVNVHNEEFPDGATRGQLAG